MTSVVIGAFAIAALFMVGWTVNEIRKAHSEVSMLPRQISFNRDTTTNPHTHIIVVKNKRGHTVKKFKGCDAEVYPAYGRWMESSEAQKVLR